MSDDFSAYELVYPVGMVFVGLLAIGMLLAIVFLTSYNFLFPKEWRTSVVCHGVLGSFFGCILMLPMLDWSLAGYSPSWGDLPYPLSGMILGLVARAMVSRQNQ